MFESTVSADHEAMSRCVADRLIEILIQTPEALLCLAAGSSPCRTYELLAERHISDSQLFDRVRVLKLDEWGGMAMDDPATCERFLRECLLDQLGIADRYLGFESNPGDPEAECRRVADWLTRNGPIDACVLGLGMNGHIGFNEPGAALNAHAHVAKLSQSSLHHRMLLQTERRPAFGLTLGMIDLMHSREVLLLVSGKAKRAPLRRLLDGPIATEFPASLLALHPNVTLFADADAVG